VEGIVSEADVSLGAGADSFKTMEVKTGPSGAQVVTGQVDEQMQADVNVKSGDRLMLTVTFAARYVHVSC
jgi:hypothetical protein